MHLIVPVTRLLEELSADRAVLWVPWLFHYIILLQLKSSTLVVDNASTICTARVIWTPHIHVSPPVPEGRRVEVRISLSKVLECAGSGRGQCILLC